MLDKGKFPYIFKFPRFDENLKFQFWSSFQSLEIQKFLVFANVRGLKSFGNSKFYKKFSIFRKSRIVDIFRFPGFEGQM